MPRFSRPCLFACVALGALGAPLLLADEQGPKPAVQPEAKPEPAKPADQPPSQTEVLESILRNRAPAPTPAQATGKAQKAPPSPVLNLAELLQAPAASLGALEREGVLVSRARAQLVRVGGERKIPVLVFHSETKQEVRRPMIVLPTRKLEELEALQDQLGQDAQFTISGVVEVYRGNNYIQLKRVEALPKDGNLE